MHQLHHPTMDADPDFPGVWNQRGCSVLIFHVPLSDITIWIHSNLRKRMELCDQFQIAFNFSSIYFFTCFSRTAPNGLNGLGSRVLVDFYIQTHTLKVGAARHGDALFNQLFCLSIEMDRPQGILNKNCSKPS